MRQSLNIYHSISFRLIFWVGLILMVSLSTWAYFNIRYQKNRVLEQIAAEADRLGSTIKLGAHYAMMLNSRDDINQIIKNIGRQERLEGIRIYNKEGRIQYSKNPQEVGKSTNIKDEACFICHKSEPPLESVELEGRNRIFPSPGGYRLLGIISPIYNEAGCSADACHVHSLDKKVLGALDVVVSLKETDKEIRDYERGIIGLAAFIFLGTSGIIGLFLFRFVNRPINQLITETKQIGNGEYHTKVDVQRKDEIGHLAHSIDQMGQKIAEKQAELNKQRDEYQNLFGRVPCIITVQDRNFRLLQYNREFDEKFNPEPEDYCYQAYKGRTEPCEVCPVLKTFEDGDSHSSEEMAKNKDGTESYWIVRTSPIKDSAGEIVAAMEMSLDVTQMRALEKEVAKSEEKYRIIFNTIPNPVFVLDNNDLKVLDCNDRVEPIYGFQREELLNQSFLNFFEEDEREYVETEIKTSNGINQVKQIREDGESIYVTIRISTSEYAGQEALLVTTSDITEHLMAEQQLIQASKMATLGEMATGVAHELNQPLSVIKTASSFFIKKVRNSEKIEDDILKTMSEEIDSHVDRASKIINHMREFGRKSDIKKEHIQVNEPLNRAIDIFSQQLKLREIIIIKDLEETLP
ncbi:PAS domain S-box protein, partial [Thermodesulfobacteriota bacterium]